MIRRRRFTAFALTSVVAGGLAAGAAHAGVYEEFFLGIELDRPAILQKLLARGFDLNTRNPQGQHGLYVALREHSVEVLPVFLDHPALEVDATSPAGETLLMMAALRNQHAAMRTLIARGAKVNSPGWTPLHYAASGGDLAAITLLLAQGAEVNALAPNGTTPLMMAAGYGLIDGAELLLRRGADPRMVNQAGRSAADLAEAAGRDALAARLRRLAQDAAR